MKPTTSLPLMPTPPVAMFDIWKVGIMAFELWSTSLSTITMRNHLWQTQPFFSPKKKALLNSMSGKQAPWWVTSQRTMKPYHQRSSANSRRLAK
ncbi:hypothetical protein [Vreelandella titanicae]|uniref:hypothetical protein n=1 Tax=Vreelandella titanicae TaxID=664683 RepID=UPI0039BFA15D